MFLLHKKRAEKSFYANNGSQMLLTISHYGTIEHKKPFCSKIMRMHNKCSNITAKQKALHGFCTKVQIYKYILCSFYGAIIDKKTDLFIVVAKKHRLIFVLLYDMYKPHSYTEYCVNNAEHIKASVF